jgi:hypothetical protein
MHLNQHPVLDRFCTQLRADMAQMGPSSDSRRISVFHEWLYHFSPFFLRTTMFAYHLAV